ncbi:MAG: NAD(P)H-hydrate dehydratase [Armatimonadetes bacterium]|nr:NAD(P)H-hydrate dehydratase [Armatimonadota bacterium]
MEAATAAQSRSIDRRTIEKIGIPSMVLMENAGLAVVAAVVRRLGGVRGRAVAILCGKGSNGGDGFVVARHLAQRGALVRLFLAARAGELSGDARAQAEIAAAIGLAVREVAAAETIGAELATADLVVDALLGTGTRGDVTGLFGDLIDLLNDSGRPVVAVDVPSGLHADTGQACGRCVRAVETVAFGVLKRGLVIYPGAEYAGRVTLAPISIPALAVTPEAIDVTFVEAPEARALLPRREAWAHKGSAGSVLVIGGSMGMTGAAAMASLSALRAGAGLVRLAAPRSLGDILEARTAEVITLPVAETASRAFAPEGFREALAAAGESECVALGPGLGRDPEARRGFLEALPSVRAPMVIDADGLNALAQSPETFARLTAPAVITPHPGEMSRLLGKSTAQVQADRLGAAREAAARFGVTAVLKGARTVIAGPDGAAFINSTGNPGMATAGMGDVLTGAVAGLVAQGLGPREAAILGVFIHGLAGDLAASERGATGILAGDAQERLPAALQALREGRVPPVVHREPEL